MNFKKKLIDFCNNKFNLIILVSFFLIFIIDRILKSYLLNKTSFELLPFLSISLSKNYGVSLSLFSGYVGIIIIFSILILSYLLFLLKNNPTYKSSKLFLIFIIAGGFGNLIDRIFYGYVIDFLHFYIGNFSFPIFNFADIFIFVGAFLLAFNILLKKESGLFEFKK